MSFFLREPDEDTVQQFLRNESPSQFSYTAVGATRTDPPKGYTLDHHRIQLSSGSNAFQKAKLALCRWRQFDLGWISIVPKGAPIKPKTLVAVKAKSFGFWSLNACRIVYVIDEENRYAFAYGTLTNHAETGEERFSIERLSDDSVWYDVLAFSRPREIAVRAAAPLARMLQKRFAKHSMMKMMSEVVR
ncbi:MAG: DUF1990 domain-containing protein [Pyrinomonadaceae bacterium]